MKYSCEVPCVDFLDFSVFFFEERGRELGFEFVEKFHIGELVWKIKRILSVFG